MDTRTHVKIENEWGIVVARQAGRKMTKDLGFGSVDQARITTAISELARNIYIYAGEGHVYIERVVNSSCRLGIRITAVDEGPGIENLQMVMADGFTTSNGLGAGLPGVKRLMDNFTIDTTVDGGTIVTIEKWLQE